MRAYLMNGQSPLFSLCPRKLRSYGVGDLPTSQITQVYFAAPKSVFFTQKCILQVHPQKMLVIQLSNTQTNTADVPAKLNLFYKSLFSFIYLFEHTVHNH